MSHFSQTIGIAWIGVAGVLLTVFTISAGRAQELILTDSITPDSINATAGQAAQEAADAWLALIDSTDYAASWQQAAPMFQQQVSEAQWVQMLESVRGPLGPLHFPRPAGARVPHRPAGCPGG